MEFLNLDNYLSEITERYYETQEEFIFETILPFCSQIDTLYLSKEYLIKALAHYKDLEQENELLRAKCDRLYDKNKALSHMYEELRSKIGDIQIIIGE